MFVINLLNRVVIVDDLIFQPKERKQLEDTVWKNHYSKNRDFISAATNGFIYVSEKTATPNFNPSPALFNGVIASVADIENLKNKKPGNWWYSTTEQANYYWDGYNVKALGGGGSDITIEAGENIDVAKNGDNYTISVANSFSEKVDGLTNVSYVVSSTQPTAQPGEIILWNENN